jgi:hypothetical protein
MIRNRILCLVVLAVFVAGSVCLAQVSTSRITGTVYDKTGAVVAEAKVTATHEETGLKQETTTTSAGVYTFASLPVGSYTVTVEMTGFQKWVSTKNILTVGAPIVVDATLEVGRMDQVVQVEASFARLETTSAMLSGVVSHREVAYLPLNGRNPLSLIILEPGLVQRTTGAAGSGTHVFGSRDRAHNVTIDGIEANESSVPNPQSNLHRLNPDNVQEYRVVTLNATPEFGRNSGANVAIATRSGTNDFHGDVFWFHRNTVLNANEWFNNASGIERPVLLLHQFGADGGGPIVKNKTFFFASWQGNRINQTMPIAQSFGVPYAYTALAKQGIFRYFVPDPANPLVIGGVTITRNNPLLVDSSGALRAGVVMCATPTSVGCIRTYNMFTQDPAGIGPDTRMAAMFNSFPSPNTFGVGDGLNFAGYSWNPPSMFTGPAYMVRIDHKFNENNNLFGRALWSDWNTTKGDFLNARPSTFPGFPPQGNALRKSVNIAISYRRVFSPRLVNEYTMGFSRFRYTFPLAEVNATNPPPYGQECFGSDSLSNVDTPFCNTPHTQRMVNTFQFIDNLSYIRGAHTFRMGFNIRKYQHNDERGVPGGFNMTPTIIYSRSTRSPFGTTANTYPGVAAGWPAAANINSTDNNNLGQTIVEMMGIPARVQAVYIGAMPTDTYVYDMYHAGTRARQYNFYFQDEWKIRRNLTFNYGARWELNPPPTDSHDRVFVPDRPVDGSQGTVTYVRAKNWFKRLNLAAIAPRVSLAWDPWSNGKSVIRLGYGIAYDTISTFQVTSINGKVPGSVLQCIVNVQDGPTGACKDITNNVRLGGLLTALNWTSFDPFDYAAQAKIIGPPTGTPSSQLTPPVGPSGTAQSLGAFQPDLRIPTVHEWSLTIQRELPWAFTAQVGYVGKRGMRLYRAYDMNQDNIAQAFSADFLLAQQNLYICRTNEAACKTAQGLAGITSSSQTRDNFANFNLPGQAALPVLSALLGTGSTPSTNTGSLFRDSSYVNAVSRNGVGDLAVLIDTRSGTGWIINRTNPTTGQLFPANYFRSNAQFTEMFYFDSGGSSSYHGMIVQLQRRFEKGLTFGLSYTLAKSFDDMSVDPVAATSGGGLSTTNSRTPTDVRNFKLDRARSDFDDRHVLVVNGLYDMPFGRGQKWGSNWPGVVDHVLGGWSFTGIYTFQSGEPYTINSGVRTVHNTKQSRADLRGPMPLSTVQDTGLPSGPVVFSADSLIEDSTNPYNNCRHIIDTDSYFCIPGPGQPGMGRNMVPGPGFWNLDLGINKKFTITERVKLDFRTEFFNVFNHPNFENPRNATVGSPTVTSSVFGQVCCVTAAVPSSTTIIATGEPNRVIQFALKLSF